MNHSLHTAIIDRRGKVVANIEGNQFTADQLGDLTEAALSST
jgi:protein SCO1/2